jgi:hypothetical protein
MADPTLPRSVERDLEVAKATSRSPALTPGTRARQERRGYATAFERNAQLEQQKREDVYVAPDGSRPRNVLEAGTGRPLSGVEVQRRLLVLNPSLIFQDSPHPGRICILRRLSDPVLGDTLHYVCAMERGLMPEFSVLNFIEQPYFDAATQATPLATGTMKTRLVIDSRNPETRGWRTVVLRLIKERLVTREGVERLFGLPSHDSANWQRSF